LSANLYFEDFRPGREWTLGTWSITAEQIVEFGLEWDPLPFHTDPEAPADGPYGGLIASGRHSTFIWMRLYVDAVLSKAISLGSPGIDEVKWHRPVRPGDVLTAHLKVLEARPSSSRPERGTVVFEGSIVNQDGEVATTIRGANFIGRRP
jgi:acyl dehydratase